MNLKALLLALSLLSLLAIPLLPVNAGQTVYRPDLFSYETTGGPQNLDPARCYDTASAEVVLNVYLPLLQYDFVHTDAYTDVVSDWWPGYGVNPGNAITEYPPAPWTFVSVGLPALSAPMGTHWGRKGVDYWVTAWTDTTGDGYLDHCDQVTLTWCYDPNYPLTGTEDLDFHVESITLDGGHWDMVLTPKFIYSTWYFHIRTGIKWQNSLYGTVTPYDVEYTFERDMIHNPSSGPVWMLLDPLLGVTSTRGGAYNWPKYAYYNPALPDQTAMLARQIDDSVESNSTFVWFNLNKPYAPFQQILTQSWGVVLCAAWTIAQWDPVSNTHNWNASWHITPGYAGYKCIAAFNKPAQPGPLGGTNTMGCGPYTISFIDLGTGEFYLTKFDNYFFGWTKGYCTTIHHTVVATWETRRSDFLSGTADEVVVLRENVNDPQLLAAISDGRVRYIKDLGTLSADAIFWSWDFDSSLYPNYIGTSGGLVMNDTLLSDVHMRLALAYCFNASEFIQDYFLGEALPLHDPDIYGIAYCNATKQAYMGYTKNIALATYHFKMAWGGRDPDGIPNSGDEIGGQVWNYGFEVQIEPTPDQDPRDAPCRMIRDVVNNEIEWPVSNTNHLIVVNPLDWDYAMDQVAERTLGAYVCGWLVDYPHPHDWFFPFMHTEGDFTWTCSIEYGRKEEGGSFGSRVIVQDTAGMNWAKGGNYGQNGLPYKNWEGKTVTDINNTYVDDTIMTGIGVTDPVKAQKLYTELQDIYYADCGNIMTYQPSARHYERTSVQGWFYNAIYSGLMFYGTCHTMNIWKQDPQTVTRLLYVHISLSACTLIVGSTTIAWIDIDLRIVNWIISPEYVYIYLYYYDATGTKKLQYYGTIWIAPGETIVVGEWTLTTGMSLYGVAAMCQASSCYINPPWALIKMKTSFTKKAGDLGGGVPAKFFKYDGAVDGKDLSLFLRLFRNEDPYV